MRSRLMQCLVAATLLFSGLVAVEGSVGVNLAGAATTAPKVTNFTPSVTQVNGAGGAVSFTATIKGPGGGYTCTLSSSPAITGLPASNDCTAGSWLAALPGNPGSTQVKYTFTLTVVPTLYPTTPGKATTKVTSLVKSGSMYVAMGDSYSSGEGNPGPTGSQWLSTSGASWSGDDGCHRSAAAYPVAVKNLLPSTKFLPPMGFRFVACSGALTPDIWNYNAPFNNSANGNEGLQDGWTADLANARIVTISIGGNDLHFEDILTNCIVGAPLHSCDAGSNDGWIAKLNANIATLQASLVKTYRHIETLAPHAALYVVGYPYLVPPKPSKLQQNVTCPVKMAGLSSSGVGYLADNEVALNTMIQGAASQAGAHFVDLNSGDGSFDGHSVCAGNPWVSGPKYPTAYSFHPNAKGQAAMAKLVWAAINDDHSVSPTILSSSEPGVPWTYATDSSAGNAVLVYGNVGCQTLTTEDLCSGGSWASIPKSAWIWKSQNVTSSEAAYGTGPVVFTSTFNVPSRLSATVTADLSYLFDDALTVSVNGVEVPLPVPGGGFTSPTTTTITLMPGVQNVVTFTVTNAPGGFGSATATTSNPAGVSWLITLAG